METKQFQELLEELKVAYRKLCKEPQLDNKEAVRSKLKELSSYKSVLSCIRDKFNSAQHKPEVISQAKIIVDKIEKYLKAISDILEKKAFEIESKQTESTGILKEIKIEKPDSEWLDSVKMGEKFDLKTAASLLPIMNGVEDVTKQLIDGIDLYDSLLEDSGKKSLTNYVLKTRITQNAKIRLQSTYASNQDLIRDIETHFLTKKSAATLSLQLGNIRQNGRSIEDFGRKIEDLLADLTIAQADGNLEAMKILGPVNEKIAINSFANGLNRADLRTIVKSRNFTRLGDAIRGAKDEQLSQDNTSNQVLHMRVQGSYRGNTRGKGIQYNSNVQNQRKINNFNHYKQNSNFNSQRSNFNSNYRQANRTKQPNNFNRGQNRGKFRRYNGNTQKVYSHATNEEFFRSQREQ
jgi:hypothetical protein